MACRQRLLAAMVKMAHAVVAHAEHTPDEVLAALNGALCGKFERSFVTAVFVDVTWSNGEARLRFASAGHPAPLLLRARDGSVEELEASGPILGRFRGARFTRGERVLAPGDRLLLISDGIVEAPGAQGEAYGEQRLQTILREQHALPAESFLARLLDDVAKWTAGAPALAADREDDRTVVVLDRRSEPAP